MTAKATRFMFSRTIKALFLLLVPTLLYAATPRTLNGGCSIVFAAADLAKTSLKLCQVPDNATLIEIGIAADAGTPSVTMARFRPNGALTANLQSGALSTGASGAFACSKTTAITSLNGTTTCAATLQNTALQKGDWIQLSSGAASTAVDIQVAVTWTW